MSETYTTTKTIGIIGPLVEKQGEIGAKYLDVVQKRGPNVRFVVDDSETSRAVIKKLMMEGVPCDDITVVTARGRPAASWTHVVVTTLTNADAIYRTIRKQSNEVVFELQQDILNKLEAMGHVQIITPRAPTNAQHSSTMEKLAVDVPACKEEPLRDICDVGKQRRYDLVPSPVVVVDDDDNDGGGGDDGGDDGDDDDNNRSHNGGARANTRKRKSTTSSSGAKLQTSSGRNVKQPVRFRAGFQTASPGGGGGGGGETDLTHKAKIQKTYSKKSASVATARTSSTKNADDEFIEDDEEEGEENSFNKSTEDNDDIEDDDDEEDDDKDDDDEDDDDDASASTKAAGRKSRQKKTAGNDSRAVFRLDAYSYDDESKYPPVISFSDPSSKLQSTPKPDFEDEFYFHAQDVSDLAKWPARDWFIRQYEAVHFFFNNGSPLKAARLKLISQLASYGRVRTLKITKHNEAKCDFCGRTHLMVVCAVIYGPLAAPEKEAMRSVEWSLEPSATSALPARRIYLGSNCGKIAQCAIFYFSTIHDARHTAYKTLANPDGNSIGERQQEFKKKQFARRIQLAHDALLSALRVTGPNGRHLEPTQLEIGWKTPAVLDG